MLFAVLGALLEKAGIALRTDAVSAGGEHADVQRRRVAAFVVRVGRMWPAVLGTLEEENSILGAAVADAGGDTGGADEDPVAEHVRLLAELDRLVEVLHDRGDVTARRALRRRLAEAARVEMALVAR